jgi:hypothetical protein
LELKQLSAQYKIPTSKFDLEIQKVTTLYKDEDHEEYEEANHEVMEHLEDSDYLANEELEVVQEYEVLVILADEEQGSIKLSMGIGTNKVDTIAVIVVKKGSYLDNTLPTEMMSGMLHDEINKLKLKKGIYVGLWDKEQDLGVRTLMDEFQKNSTLSRDVKFTITRVNAYKEPVNDALIEHYKDDGEEEEAEFMAHDKVDHYDRGAVIGVKEGELVLEYIKPQDGVGGKTFQGKLIMGQPAVAENIPAFLPAETIRVSEDDSSIKYYATKKGFIEFADGKLAVSDNLEIQSVDMKSTGHIRAGLDTGIVISLQENDPMKDAVGAGVHIEVTGINVVGNLGGDTFLKAHDVKIDGQTHRDAVIETDSANIKVHKGKLKALSVEIDRLEHGRVDAEEVTINSMLGGEVHANRVKINTLYKNGKVYANDAIEIDNISGDDNLIILTPLARDDDREAYEAKRAEYDGMEDKLKFVISKQDEKKSDFAPIKKAFHEVSQALKAYKEKGEKYPQALVIEYKALKKQVEAYNEDSGDNKDQMSVYKELKQELKTTQNQVLQAKVIKNTPWGSYFNKVIFELVFIKDEIEYQPSGKEEMIKLVKNENRFEVEVSER